MRRVYNAVVDSVESGGFAAACSGMIVALSIVSAQSSPNLHDPSDPSGTAGFAAILVCVVAVVAEGVKVAILGMCFVLCAVMCLYCAMLFFLLCSTVLCPISL